MDLDRFWLLTWTTYSSWLPGDPRGSVTSVRNHTPKRKRHNQPGAPVDPEMPGLETSARLLLKSGPMRLSPSDAEVLFGQFHETVRFREWKLFAGAIMANHVHVVVGVPGDPDPAMLLRDLKSYGSRALNRAHASTPRATWWTQSGSRRLLKSHDAVRAAARYVRDQ